REQSSQLEKRLARARRARFTELRTRLTRSMTRLQAFHPARDLAAKRERLAQLNRRLARVTPAYLSARQRRLDELNRAFRAISPERTLERGYAIVTRRDTGDIVKDAKQVAPGEKVQARLAQGTLVAVVETSE
nr:exodeoxyribonuclease VII large subunit [Gammaproteobacteria bacterium]